MTVNICSGNVDLRSCHVVQIKYFEHRRKIFHLNNWGFFFANIAGSALSSAAR